MHVIEATNVNDALTMGWYLINGYGERQGSRAGEVLAAPFPVTTSYERPQERVLLSEARDANPFFHLFEALWIMAGRNDGTWLDTFVHDFSERFGEQGGTIWGAYGHRWRHHFDTDQLAIIVNRLRRNPLDRRVVLMMWDPIFDLEGPEDPADPWPSQEYRDVPCNTQAFPRVRTEGTSAVLDLTVTCRSNDIVWGAYGANAVQFSVLQEYLAAAIGVGVGRLYQVSNNWHIYLSERDRLAARWYSSEKVGDYPGWLPMVTVPSEFIRDCERFCQEPLTSVYANEWFRTVAVPMLTVHADWRAGRRTEAVVATDHIAALDWRLAAQRWMARRMEKTNAP